MTRDELRETIANVILAHWGNPHLPTMADAVLAAIAGAGMAVVGREANVPSIIAGLQSSLDLMNKYGVDRVLPIDDSKLPPPRSSLKTHTAP